MIGRVIVAVLVVGVSLFLFIFSYLLDKRTPQPEGCEDVSSCAGCHVANCSNRKTEEIK